MTETANLFIVKAHQCIDHRIAVFDEACIGIRIDTAGRQRHDRPGAALRSVIATSAGVYKSAVCRLTVRHVL